MAKLKKLTTAAGAPVPDNENAITAASWPKRCKTSWYQEKIGSF